VAPPSKSSCQLRATAAARPSAAARRGDTSTFAARSNRAIYEAELQQLLTTMLANRELDPQRLRHMLLIPRGAVRQSADVAEDFITYSWVGDKLSNRRDGIFNRMPQKVKCVGDMRAKVWSSGEPVGPRVTHVMSG